MSSGGRCNRGIRKRRLRIVRPISVPDGERPGHFAQGQEECEVRRAKWQVRSGGETRQCVAALLGLLGAAHQQLSFFAPRKDVLSRSERRPSRQLFQSRSLRTLHFSRCTSCFSLFLFLGVALSAHAADKPAALPLDVRPYHVRLLVAFDAPQLSAAARQDVLDETRRAAQRCVGEMWQLQVDPIAWLQPVNSEGLARLDVAKLTGSIFVPDAASVFVADAASVRQQTPTTLDADAGSIDRDDRPVDVWFVATVQAARPGYRIDVRSWQPEIQVATAAVGVYVADPRDMSVAILKLCWLAFRPVGVVEGVEDKTARVRLQAGSLAAPDEAFALAQQGDSFVPSIAVRTREHRIEKLQSIPWTYLTATEVEGARVTCDIDSGLRSPIGGKPRARTETLVVAVRPQHAATRLELATQTKPSLPLVAHRIELRSSPITPKLDDDVAREEHLLRELLTDRRGLVVVPTDSERPLVWLFAYSGQHLLARVPFVPGCVSEVRLEVPDDAARLTAEADVQMLQGELVDAVAIRTTQFATIRSAAKQSDWKQVRAKMNDLPKLADPKSFLDRLAAIRVPTVNAAKARKDRTAEVRINRLCDEMAELINQYLNEDKLKQFREEVAELLKSEADSNAEPPAK